MYYIVTCIIERGFQQWPGKLFDLLFVFLRSGNELQILCTLPALSFTVRSEPGFRVTIAQHVEDKQMFAAFRGSMRILLNQYLLVCTSGSGTQKKSTTTTIGVILVPLVRRALFKCRLTNVDNILYNVYFSPSRLQSQSSLECIFIINRVSTMKSLNILFIRSLQGVQTCPNIHVISHLDLFRASVLNHGLVM